MAQTITPVVHGGSRRRWAGAVALHVVGAAISAAALGALLGGAGVLLGAPWGRVGALLVASIALAYAAREIIGLAVPILEMRRQVPEWWRGSFGPRTAAFLYGVALGPGFATHLRHGTFVAASAAALVLGDPILGAVMLGAFGVARSGGIALVSAARTEPAVAAASDRLERVGSGSLPRIANAAVLLVLAVASLLVPFPSGAPAPWLWPALLAATFGWAALAKLLGRESWSEGIRAYSLPDRVERLALPSVPLAEASVAALLLGGAIRAGAVVALLLLAAFSLALIRAGFGGTLPCGCFGGRARRSVRWLLARNGALSLAGLASLLLGSPIPFPSTPGPGELLPAALSIWGLGLAVWLAVRGASLASAVRR